MNKEAVMLIEMRKDSISWLLRDEISTISSGTELLTSTYGDYDALLSNVVSYVSKLATRQGKVVQEFIFRKA